MKMLIFMEFRDSDPPNRGRGLGGGAPHRATPRHFDYLYSIGFASRGCQGSAWILSGAKYPETCRGIRRRRRAMVGHAAPFRGAASDFFNTSRNIWPRRGSKRILGIRGTQIRSSIDSRNDEVWILMPRRGPAAWPAGWRAGARGTLAEGGLANRAKCFARGGGVRGAAAHAPAARCALGAVCSSSFREGAPGASPPASRPGSRSPSRHKNPHLVIPNIYVRSHLEGAEGGERRV